MHSNPLPNDFRFELLTSAVRSPFFGVDPNLMYDFFKELGAEEVFPIQKNADSEGCVLFRQSKIQETVHILVAGAIVFFLDPIDQKRIPGLPITEEKPVGAEVSIEDTGDSDAKILKDSSCCGIIGVGQVAGLHELLLSHILSSPNAPNGDADKVEADRQSALSNTSLRAVAGTWLYSGFLARGSKVIRVPVDRFRNALSSGRIDKMLSAKDPEAGDVNFTTEKFIRRCEEETMFLNASYLHDKALTKERRHDVRLAHVWSEYYIRASANITRRFNNYRKGYMRDVKVERLAWLMGISKEDVKVASDQLIRVGILQRVSSTGKASLRSSENGGHIRSSCFNFDPRACRDYYLLNGDAEALKKSYGGKYSLQPLGQGQTI